MGTEPVLRMGWGLELPFWLPAPAAAGQELGWVLAGSATSSTASEQSSFYAPCLLCAHARKHSVKLLATPGGVGPSRTCCRCPACWASVQENVGEKNLPPTRVRLQRSLERTGQKIIQTTEAFEKLF